MREATHKDVPEIKNLALKTISERGWNEYAQVDEHTIETLTRYYMRSHNGFVWVHETEGKIDGFFVGYCAPFLLDLRSDSLHEMLSGGEGVEKLWDEFFLWGKQKKAVIAIRGCYDAFNGSRFRRV